MLSWFWVVAVLAIILIVMNALRIYTEYAADKNTPRAALQIAPLAILAGLIFYLNQNVFALVTESADNDLIAPATRMIRHVGTGAAHVNRRLFHHIKRLPRA